MNENGTNEIEKSLIFTSKIMDNILNETTVCQSINLTTDNYKIINSSINKINEIDKNTINPNNIEKQISIGKLDFQYIKPQIYGIEKFNIFKNKKYEEKIIEKSITSLEYLIKEIDKAEQIFPKAENLIKNICQDPKNIKKTFNPFAKIDFNVKIFPTSNKKRKMVISENKLLNQIKVNLNKNNKINNYMKKEKIFDDIKNEKFNQIKEQIKTNLEKQINYRKYNDHQIRNKQLQYNQENYSQNNGSSRCSFSKTKNFLNENNFKNKNRELVNSNLISKEKKNLLKNDILIKDCLFQDSKANKINNKSFKEDLENLQNNLSNILNKEKNVDTCTIDKLLHSSQIYDFKDITVKSRSFSRNKNNNNSIINNKFLSNQKNKFISFLNKDTISVNKSKKKNSNNENNKFLISTYNIKENNINDFTDINRDNILILNKLEKNWKIKTSRENKGNFTNSNNIYNMRNLNSSSKKSIKTSRRDSNEFSKKFNIIQNDCREYKPKFIFSKKNNCTNYKNTNLNSIEKINFNKKLLITNESSKLKNNLNDLNSNSQKKVKIMIDHNNIEKNEIKIHCYQFKDENFNLKEKNKTNRNKEVNYFLILDYKQPKKWI